MSKTKILLIVLTIFIVIIIVNILKDRIIPEQNTQIMPSQSPSPKVILQDPNIQLDLRKPDLNPTVVPGFTKPWGVVDNLKIFRVSVINNTCDPKEITIGKGEKVEIIFEDYGEIENLEEQTNVTDDSTSEEAIYYFDASKTGIYNFSCSGEGGNGTGKLIIK